jgi:hypothetical protein
MSLALVTTELVCPPLSAGESGMATDILNKCLEEKEWIFSGSYVTPRKLVVRYRRFGTTYLSNHKKRIRD